MVVAKETLDVNSSSRDNGVVDVRDYWEQAGGVFLDALMHRRVLRHCARLPKTPNPVNAGVPVVGYRGAYRTCIAGDITRAIFPRFWLSCWVLNGSVEIELRQDPEASITVLGRPILGYCSKQSVSGYYGDQYSRDTGLVGLRAHVERQGAAIMVAEHMDGRARVLDGVSPEEVGALADICLNVFLSKQAALTSSTPNG